MNTQNRINFEEVLFLLMDIANSNNEFVDHNFSSLYEKMPDITEHK